MTPLLEISMNHGHVEHISFSQQQSCMEVQGMQCIPTYPRLQNVISSGNDVGIYLSPINYFDQP